VRAKLADGAGRGGLKGRHLFAIEWLVVEMPSARVFD